MFGGLAVAAALVGFLAVGATSAQQSAGQPQGGTVMGRGGMMGRCGMMGRGARGGPMGGARLFLGQLGLSDDQRAQVKSILAGHQADFQALQTKMRPARQALQNAIMNGADEATIRQAAAGVAAAQADGAVLRAHVHAQVFAVLTPDQQAKAKQLQARHGRGTGL
jgi:protein CpxP